MIAILVLAVAAVGAFAVMRLAAADPRVTPADPGVQAITIASAALGKDMAVRVFTPDGYDAQHSYPILFLFPGRGGDERAWMGQDVGIDGIRIESIARAGMDAGTVAKAIIVSATLDDS